MAMMEYTTVSNLEKTPKTDTMDSRLLQINSVLGDSENIIDQLLQKIHGPSPSKDNPKELEPSGLSAQTMAINARAQRIRTALSEISDFLA